MTDVGVRKLIREFVVKLCIDQVCIITGLLPVLSRTEFFDAWVHPWLSGVEPTIIFVRSQSAFEVKLVLVWHSEVLSARDQMVDGSTVASVVEVNVAEGVVALSRPASLDDLREQALVMRGLYSSR